MTSKCCDAQMKDGKCTYCGERTTSIEDELTFRKRCEQSIELQKIVDYYWRVLHGVKL